MAACEQSREQDFIKQWQASVMNIGTMVSSQFGPDPLQDPSFHINVRVPHQQSPKHTPAQKHAAQSARPRTRDVITDDASVVSDDPLTTSKASRISPQRQLMNEPKEPDKEVGDTPGAKRLRRRSAEVHYDMKYHPMDEATRPKASQRRRVKLGVEDSSTIQKEERPQSVLIPEAQGATPRESPRRVTRERTPNYNATWHPMDEHTNSADDETADSNDEQEVDDPTQHNVNNPTIITSSAQQGDTLQRPEDSTGGSLHPQQRRRSVRFSNDEESVLKYDARHHPMDQHMRPKQAADRLKRKLDYTNRNNALGEKTSNKLLSTTVHRSSSSKETKMLKNVSIKGQVDSTKPALVRTKGPLKSSASMPNQTLEPTKGLIPDETAAAEDFSSDQFVLNWSTLKPSEQEVFLLQKGASADGNALPHTWDQAKQYLFDCGYITLDMLNSPEGTEDVVTCYEAMRVALQTAFRAAPEPSKEDWMICRSEDFDVFDLKPGVRYWTSKREQTIERPTSLIEKTNVPQIEREPAGFQGHEDGDVNIVDESMPAALRWEKDILESMQTREFRDLQGDEPFDMSTIDAIMDGLVEMAPPDSCSSAPASTDFLHNATAGPRTPSVMDSPLPRSVKITYGQRGRRNKRKTGLGQDFVIYEDSTASPESKAPASVNSKGWATQNNDLPTENFPTSEEAVSGSAAANA